MSAARRTSCLCAAAALVAGTAGCPLPQPLAEVARVDGGAVTVSPPRIVDESVLPPDTVFLLQRGCPGGPRVTVSATVRDDNTLEQAEARWFVDYSPDALGARPYHVDLLPPPEDIAQTDRPLPPLELALPASDPAATHVLDLVVSNGFYVLDDPAAPARNRSPLPGFETQVYRWVFSYADSGGSCRYP